MRRDDAASGKTAISLVVSMRESMVWVQGRHAPLIALHRQSRWSRSSGDKADLGGSREGKNPFQSAMKRRTFHRCVEARCRISAAARGMQRESAASPLPRLRVLPRTSCELCYLHLLHKSKLSDLSPSNALSHPHARFLITAPYSLLCEIAGFRC